MLARIGKWFDGFALSASALCLAHCLGLPLLIAALPVVANRIDPGESFHLIALLFAIPTSAFALVEGWRRHRGVAPLFVGGAGLTLMAAGLAFEQWEAIEAGVTVAGSLLLASAHIANWRRRTGRTAPSS